MENNKLITEQWLLSLNVGFVSKEEHGVEFQHHPYWKIRYEDKCCFLIHTDQSGKEEVHSYTLVKTQEQFKKFFEVFTFKRF